MEGDFAILSPELEDVFKSSHELALQRHFRLLDLPPELWLRVLHLAVVYDLPIDPTKAHRLRDQEAIVKQPAILRTCRLLRQEGLSMR